MSATSTKSPRLSGPERRAQLLDVTKAIVGERGFHAISIDAVARRAGITRPVVYGHFDDLAGLLNALVQREGERAVAQVLGLIPQETLGQDPVELVRQGLRAFLEAVAEDPVTWRLVLMPPEGTPEILRARAVEVRARVTAQIAAIVPQVLAEVSGPEPIDPELTALTIQAVAEDAARLSLDDPERFPIERLLAHTEWLLTQ
nr:TetR/AcrR family transcriptional regulator [Actinomycetota bacterium]